MAALTDLADDVYIITNRPDLVQETRVALRKAIFKCHAADTFKRDLAVQRLTMSTYTPLAADQYRWAIPVTDFPRFRRPASLMYPVELSYPTPIPAPLRDWPPGFQRERVYRERAADNIFDQYRDEIQNYFFIAGSVLTIKSANYVDYLDFSYYQWPVVPAAGAPSQTVTSWIADQYPDAIIEEAAATVFKMIGKDEENQRYMQLFAENLAMLRATDIGEGV